jgi:hypothetical protein
MQAYLELVARLCYKQEQPLVGTLATFLSIQAVQYQVEAAKLPCQLAWETVVQLEMSA